MDQSISLQQKSIDRFLCNVNFAKNKLEQILVLSIFLYKLLHYRQTKPFFVTQIMCVSGAKKCLFFKKFGVLCVLETPVL